MKKFTFWKSMLLLCALVVGSSNLWAATVDDVLNQTFTGITGTSYTEFSDKTGTSGAVYAGQCAGGNSSIQLRSSNNNSGVVTTTSGGKATKVVVEWNSNTSSGRTLNVYGKNTAYSAATDLYNISNQGTLLGTIVCGTSTELTISGDYEYIGFRSASSAMYLTSVTITWSQGAATKVLTPSITGTEKFLESTEVTITCGTEDAAITYSTDGGTNWSDYTAPFTLTETTTVTAKATKDGLTDSDEASKTFTKVTPMTVAEALEAIDALADNGTIDDQYVTGKISQIDSYSSSYKSITYWISDDGNTTSQMEVYSGKGLNGADFSSVTDLNVGDVVTVFGVLKKYVKNSTTTPEFNSGSQIIARTELPASDLTKTSDITLDYKNGATDADLTDYFTTSSTGAITYTVADETVIERAEELISALKVGTTTVTVSQAATLSYKAGEITINVTVQDTREAATTIPGINISTLKVGNSGTLNVTSPVKADEGVTFAYTSSDDAVLLIVDDEYEAVAVGTATVTVTATPSNTNLYKSVTANFEVTIEADVKTDTEIVLDATSGSTVYGTAKSVDFTITDGYDGTMAYTIDNASIVDVEIGASAITFTPKAVGTAVITISAPATATFNAADDVEYNLTVTAPAGGTEAAAATFDKVTSISEGDYLIVYEEGSLAFDGSLETLDAVGNTVAVTVTSNSIAATSALKAAVFTIAAVDGGYTVKSKSGMYIGQTSDANGLASSDETAYKNTISFDSDGNANLVSGSAYLRYNSASNQTRFRYYKSSSYTGQKAIQLYKDNATVIQATLNASGYATFCSQYPLDFSAAEGYTAWQITGVSGNTITFEKVTGSVKGGTGLLLKGEAGATVTLTSSDSSNELAGNKLEGTLAPLYITADQYYGLSGDNFVKVGAGTVPAGKALLPASLVTSGSKLTFVFEDATTGINTVQGSRFTVNGSEMYNLSGQRVSDSYKGIVIVNGKKVVRK